MATFYVLPPRDCLESALGEVLGRFLPGLPLPVDAWEVLTERLSAAVSWPDVYLVPRDELPEGEPLAEALTAFGAEPGDRVVEVPLARSATPRTWVVAAAAVSGIAVAR